MKRNTVQLHSNSEKNVKCNILACFTKHSGARDMITSHFVGLNLVHLNMMSHSGKLDSALGVGYLTSVVISKNFNKGGSTHNHAHSLGVAQL